MVTLIFDLLTLKVVCQSHKRWDRTLIPKLGTLGIRVLELFGMYATDGRTDRQKQSLLPLPYGRGHNNNNDMNNNNNNSVFCRRSMSTSKPNFVVISIHARVISISGLEKQTSVILIGILFRLLLRSYRIVIGVLFCIRLPNFVQIGPSGL